MATPTLGARIKAARSELRWSQKEAADKIGVSARLMYSWEADHKIPGSIHLQAIQNELIDKVNARRVGTPTPPMQAVYTTVHVRTTPILKPGLAKAKKRPKSKKVVKVNHNLTKFTAERLRNAKRGLVDDLFIKRDRIDLLLTLLGEE